MAGYAHPEKLVTTDWVAQHKDDANVRLVEVDVDTTAYDQGHIPGAVGWNWERELQDATRRTIAGKDDFQKLVQNAGINKDTTVVLYGDNNNWFAAWAFWQLEMYGFQNVKLMNGGRKKWIEEGRDTTTDVPSYQASSVTLPEPDQSIRAKRDDVFNAIDNKYYNLVDVRSPDEFSGKVIAPPGMSETAQRGGHVPTAKSIPWSQAVNEDGTFKSREDLEKLYEGKGVNPGKPAIAYCRIGERSSHTWFVLKYLLGYDKCLNYDGSWTEWGNLVEAPIEKGEPVAA
jgi:thiosulfate/3-mercaptopyruvate sulfurtransferase